MSHQTAIKRTTPSAPATYLLGQGLLVGKKLDYGCGYGKDAELLHMDKYDPHYFPTEPTKKYKTITCTYVFNVIEKIEDRNKTLKHIKSLLTKKGTAYISIRRDIKKKGKTSKGYQESVELDLPILYEKKSNYIIYLLQH